MGLHRKSEELPRGDGAEVLSTVSRGGTERAAAEEVEVEGAGSSGVRGEIQPGLQASVPPTNRATLRLNVSVFSLIPVSSISVTSIYCNELF